MGHELNSPKPVITVGGGRVYLPGREGAGHATHARGIIEALRAHPDVQSGKVIVQEVMQVTYQLEKLPEYMYSDLVVGTGFSGLPGDHKNYPPEGFLPESAEAHNNYKKLNQFKTGRCLVFNPDSLREMNAEFTQPSSYLIYLRNAIRNFLAKRFYYRNCIFFGNTSFQPISFAHYPVSPTITDSALTGIRAAYEDNDTAEVFRKFATSIEKENPAAAQYILQGIANALASGHEYKPIMVTGSSGGNYVAKKTLDLIDTLKGTEEKKLYQLIPILGSGKKITGPLLDDIGLPKIDAVPQELYTRLRGAAALNLSSSGASDLGEMHLLPTSTMVPAPETQNTLRDSEIEALGNRITPEWRASLKNVNTGWGNIGNLQGLAASKPHGIRIYTCSQEILAALRDPDFMNKEKNRERAQAYLKLTLEAKADLANRLITTAYECANKRKIKS